MDEDQVPSQIVPEPAPWKQTLAARLRRLKRTFLTREGLVGDYDYAVLFRPNLPFMKKKNKKTGGTPPPPFFGLNDRIPVVLALVLGFQHAVAMLAGIITPPMLLAGAARLGREQTQYLVSAALVVSGVLSAVQITRVRVGRTRYYVGTGLLSVVGVSFAVIPVASGAFAQMYANGFCPSSSSSPDNDDNGNDDGAGAPLPLPLPCPDAYGAVLGTAAVCSLLEMAISFVPPRLVLRVFPPIVTGPTVMLIGVNLIASGFKDWAGGSGPCSAPDRDPAGFFARCPDVDAPRALPWGSPEYLGLGLSVFATIVLCERFGPPIVRSTSVAVGLLAGCVVAAATGYFDGAGVDAAPAASFVWARTFRLSVYGPLVLPLMAVYVICACEAMGDITATCDVSRLEVAGALYESRIQGGVLADGISGALAALATVTPVTTFAQNNGVIALTRCANRSAGYCCCLFLVLTGVFAKFAAALVAIPAPVLGGMTTFLFCAVAVSGMSILARGGALATRRNRFVLTAGLALGFGATLVPRYFDRVFARAGPDHALRGLLDAVALVMETGFAVTALVCVVLNLALPDEAEEHVAAVDAGGSSGGDRSSDCSNSSSSDDGVGAEPVRVLGVEIEERGGDESEESKGGKEA